jgi:hypothetical protein
MKVAGLYAKLVLGVALLAGLSQADELRFDSPESWSTWFLPQGLIEFNESGHLNLKRFRRNINAAADAPLFTHSTQKRGDAVAGGIWAASSNAADAPSAIDGDVSTYWQPGADDPLARWQFDIDLGRAVLAEKIRLVFPDEEGARPFRQFTVFVSSGARIDAQDDVFKYERAFSTTIPNEGTEIIFDLTGTKDTVHVVEEGVNIDFEEKLKFGTIQYVRFIAETKNDDAALAEIEVLAVGDNLSIGTLERGGSFLNGDKAVDPNNMFDAVMDTYGNVNIHPSQASKGGWEVAGLWWQGDLGAKFWVDEVFMYWKFPGEALTAYRGEFNNQNIGTGYALLSSDGDQTLSGEIDFDPLITQEVWANDRERSIRRFRYFFQPRKIRHLFWHALLDEGWSSHPMELMLFTDGFPAEVVVKSDFIDLGQISGDGRPKVIKSVNWEAQLPPDTKMQLRSRSGNTLGANLTFFDRAGNPITEARWSSAPAVLRGPVDTTLVVGEDWGPWSNFYQFSGESFQSDSPRRFVQLEVLLSSENPEVAPILEAFWLEFEDALVQGAQGGIFPRETRVNEDTRFTYTLWPSTEQQDSGFDLLRLSVPNDVEQSSIGLEVGGVGVQPAAVQMISDSLLVTLPEVITGDSVKISFDTRVVENATVFALDLGLTQRPGLWQSVEPAERRANVVLLPGLADSRRLIGDLRITPSAFTPNGDGANDELAVEFIVFKAGSLEAEVKIFDLSGRQVAILASKAPGPEKSFTWSGRDAAGDLVAPGIYLCRIDLGADAGSDTEVHPIVVAY